MDRTRDFRSYAEMLPQRHQHGIKAPRQPPIRGFAELTKRVAADIEVSALKLEKLDILCHENAKTGQPNTEIEELTYIVQQDIATVNRALTRLKTLAQESITRTPQNHYWAHTDAVATALQRRLGGISGPFRDLLQDRKRRLKAADDRAAAARTARTAHGDGSNENYMGYGQTGPAVEMRARNRGGGGGGSGGSGGAGGAGAEGSGAVALNMGDAMVDMYMDAEAEKRSLRDKQATAIEQSLGQLEGIFSQLAGLVHDQGEQLQRIDDDISTTAFNVDGAHTEITKYLASVSTNRGLMIKTFATLLVVFTVFVIFRT